MSEAERAGEQRQFPQVPGYAWSWLQRSRLVLRELALRLTGEPPRPGFVEELGPQFARDPFVRDVVIRVIADVAFGGRAPQRRPPGTSWDRGLTWWAAAIAGVTPSEFEARSREQPPPQRQLFDPAEAPSHDTADGPEPAGAAERRDERRRLAVALRELLASADGERVPAAAVRRLIAELDPE